MTNLVIVNFNGDVLRQYSRISGVKNATYLLVANGLLEDKDAEITECLSKLKRIGRQAFAFHYAQEEPSGRVLQDVLTFALNDPTISTLSYSEDPFDESFTINNFIKKITENNYIACLKEKNIFAPFSLNMVAFREGLKQVYRMYEIQIAFEKSFDTKSQADLPTFFSAIEKNYQIPGGALYFEK